VLSVAKEHLALYPPVVVDEVGVKEIHAPSLALWRKTAKKQHLGIAGQEGQEGVILHPIAASGNIFYIQIIHFLAIVWMQKYKKTNL
jgi:hypothetical protein